jgi:ribosomal protein S18 acetylase RimI-like enzyme
MKLPAAFTLRQASVDDAPLLYDLIDRTMREFIVATWSAWSESRVQAESREDISSPNAQVISVGGVAVGVFIVERYPTHIQLDSLYLLPEYQRLGIGTALINSLVAEAGQNKIPIRLRVMAVNPAKKFYEQFGFIVTETTPEFFFMEKLT